MPKTRGLSGDKNVPHETLSEKSKMGRPPALEPTPDVFRQIRGLGRLWCSKRQMARFFEVSESTLYDFFKRVPEASIEYKRGWEEGCMHLRAIQFRLAETNARMAIFLGKIYLGQSDRARKNGPLERRDIKINVVD